MFAGENRDGYPQAHHHVELVGAALHPANWFHRDVGCCFFWSKHLLFCLKGHMLGNDIIRDTKWLCDDNQ